MIGCPDCSLFFTGASQNWLLLEHRSTAHRADPGYPGLDPGGPDVALDLDDWIMDAKGVDR